MNVSSTTTSYVANTNVKSELTENNKKTNSFKNHLEVENTSNESRKTKTGRPILMKLTIEEERHYNKMLEEKGFKPLTEAEKRLFDHVLEDNAIDNIDVFRLGFEQVKKVKFISGYIQKFPYVGDIQSGSMIGATTMTGDDKFNKALFETLKTMSGNGGMQAFMFKNQVEQNIFQTVDGKKLEASFAAHSYNREHNITDGKININFDEFFKKMLLHIDDQLIKKLPSSIRDQYDQMRKGYVALEENYNKLNNQEIHV